MFNKLLVLVLFSFMVSSANAVEKQSNLIDSYTEISKAYLQTLSVIKLWDVSIRDVNGRSANNSKEVLNTAKMNMEFSKMLLSNEVQQSLGIKVKDFIRVAKLEQGSRTVSTLAKEKKLAMENCRAEGYSCELVFDEAKDVPFDSNGQIIGLPHYRYAYILVIGQK